VYKKHPDATRVCYRCKDRDLSWVFKCSNLSLGVDSLWVDVWMNRVQTSPHVQIFQSPHGGLRTTRVYIDLEQRIQDVSPH